MYEITNHPILDIPQTEEVEFLFEGKKVRGRKGYTVAKAEVFTGHVRGEHCEIVAEVYAAEEIEYASADEHENRICQNQHTYHHEDAEYQRPNKQGFFAKHLRFLPEAEEEREHAERLQNVVDTGSDDVNHCVVKEVRKYVHLRHVG